MDVQAYYDGGSHYYLTAKTDAAKEFFSEAFASDIWDITDDPTFATTQRILYCELPGFLRSARSAGLIVRPR